MKKNKTFIIVILVMALLVIGDAIVLKKAVSDIKTAEKPTESVSDTAAEDDYKVNDDPEEDKYYDMDIEDFMAVYSANRKNRDKDNYIINGVAENRVHSFFLNKDGIGIAIGDPEGAAGTSFGILLKTTDGGKTWKVIQKAFKCGEHVYFDDTIIQFRYISNGYSSRVELFDGNGNPIGDDFTNDVDISKIFGMTDGENEYIFDVEADIIECREHSVIVGWRLAEHLSYGDMDYTGDYGNNYDSYVYIGEFDNQFNEIEQIYKNEELLEKIKYGPY